MAKAVFLDRDGTVSLEMGYIHEAALAGYDIYPGAGEALRKLGEAGFKRVLVTNQSGVARGYYPEAMVQRVHVRLVELLQKGGGALDAIYYCPHHPDPSSKPDTGEDAPGMLKAESVKALAIDCDCRKPKPGMGLRAAKDLGLDLKASWMVGDKDADAGFAKALGCRFVLVRTGYGEKTLSKLEAKSERPTWVATDLREAVDLILSEG